MANRLFSLSILALFTVTACSSDAGDPSAPDYESPDYDYDNDDDTEVQADPTCDDGLRNGAETDLDCGGADCEPCARFQVCEVDDDCADSVCFDGTCERVITVSGVAAERSLVLFEDQSLFRVDFDAEPAVTDFAGNPVVLPVSVDGFVTSRIAESFEGADLRVAGLAIEGSAGGVRYQSIADRSFFGIVLEMQDPQSAVEGFDALSAEDLAGEPVEIRLLDTSADDDVE